MRPGSERGATEVAPGKRQQKETIKTPEGRSATFRVQGSVFFHFQFFLIFLFGSMKNFHLCFNILSV